MIEIFPIYMTPYQQDRLIRVYLPPNYNEVTTHYPVLYMHDGQNIFYDEGAINGTSLSLKNYLDQNELEVIVVGIDQNPSERLNEYHPWENGDLCKKMLGESTPPSGGKGEAYVEFIVNELKPHIDSNYRTLKDRTAMGGISSGGVITTYAACRFPHIFKIIAVFSSAFYRNHEELEKPIRSSDLSLIESFYLDCGTTELANNEFISKEFLASNQAVYELLKEKIPAIQFEVLVGAEHHYRFFRERVPALFGFLGS
jgi:predicted alpha/beta superfamily hydrolase